MIIIPAIDLKSGQCVRLLQGDAGRSTVYSDRPVEMAMLWQAKGAEMLHVIDLDGSFAGSPQNQAIIKEISKKVEIPLQVGGGIRDMDTVTSYLQAGIERVILGTSATANEAFVREATERFPGRIVLAVDARDGRVAVKGWTEGTDLTPLSVVRRFEGLPLAAVIFTDIKRDGMEIGVNITATRALAQSVSIPVIASGGVAGLEDIELLINTGGPGIAGVIVGRALYNGSLDLSQAIALAKGRRPA